MKSKIIDFYYFSGTGNTLLIVQAMKEYFEENSIEVNLLRIEKSDPKTINLEHTIGIGFPVAIQSTYPFVWEFLENLPNVNSTEIFVVDTLAAISGGILGTSKKILKKKGYFLLGAKEIIMPSNYKIKPVSPKSIHKKIEKGQKVARIFAHDLQYNTAKWNSIPLLPTIIKKVSTNEKVWSFSRKKMEMDIDTSACIRCGLCYKLCPVDNIEMPEFPEFSDQCQLCLRCIAFCPTYAIMFKHRGYQQYKAVDVEKILNPNENNSGEQ